MIKLILQPLLYNSFVSNPSTHGAFLSPMNESVNIESVVCTKWCKTQDLMRQILMELQ